MLAVSQLKLAQVKPLLPLNVAEPVPTLEKVVIEKAPFNIKVGPFTVIIRDAIVHPPVNVLFPVTLKFRLLLHIAPLLSRATVAAVGINIPAPAHAPLG